MALSPEQEETTRIRTNAISTTAAMPRPMAVLRRFFRSAASLNREQLERYTKQFQNPERFFRVGGEIKAVPYKPEKDHER